MIVTPACFEDGRTVWRFQVEPEDVRVPQSVLWIDGWLRKIDDAIETVWLALALGPYVGRRLVVPGTAGARLRELMVKLLGVTIEDTGIPGDGGAGDRSYHAGLIRDSLDFLVADSMTEQTQFAIGITADNGQIGAGGEAAWIGSNAGLIRRLHESSDPLDRTAELATLWMLAPTFSLRAISSFLCREECGGLGAEGLDALATEAGLALELPLAGTSVLELPAALVGRGVGAKACFHGLWQRYRMSPKLLGALVRASPAVLESPCFTDVEYRICRYLA